MRNAQAETHFYDFAANDIPHAVVAASLHVWPSGSSYTVDPPVLDTDRDWLVLVDDLHAYASLLLFQGGFTDCLGTDEDVQRAYKDDPAFGTAWLAFRKGALNIICTSDKVWYLRAIAATELCRALNLADKEHRIRVFRNIRDWDPISSGSLSEVPLP